MRDQRRRRCCRVCDREVETCGPLSTRGKCRDCAIAAMTEQYESAGRQFSSAEYLRRWRAGMARAAGVNLPEGW